MRIGNYMTKPVVIVAGFELPVAAEGAISVRIKDLRLDFGDWKFDASCFQENGATGTLEYMAIGRRQNG